MEGVGILLNIPKSWFCIFFSRVFNQFLSLFGLGGIYKVRRVSIGVISFCVYGSDFVGCLFLVAYFSEGSFIFCYKRVFN
jgi:hypothetical protein